MTERLEGADPIPPEAIDEPDETFGDDSQEVLLAAIALRHLQSGRDVCARRGSVALPVPETGEAASARSGTPVLIYASEAGDRKVPAATWRAMFIGWTAATEDGGHPAGDDHVPPTVVVDRDRPADEPADDAPERDLGDEPDPDPDDESDGAAGFLEVTTLEQLPERDWVATNELVPKQERRARYFMPLGPRLVHLPP
ncbi:MAG: hypothetical protein WEA10_03815 [Actinomycetota bacterium]